LTGLKNLRYLRARLEEEHAASQRTHLPVALLMVDLDHFKRVNDRFGHPEGDRLLRAVSNALASVARHGETAARVGGEEFAVLLPGATGNDAFAAAERVRSAVAAVQLHPSHGGPIMITVSVGCASTADLGDMTTAELYSTADEALYESKRQGRDRTTRARSPRRLSSA
jgi:diguanylate cyclase (GGDEF)-like protein